MEIREPKTISCVFSRNVDSFLSLEMRFVGDRYMLPTGNEIKITETMVECQEPLSTVLKRNFKNLIPHYGSQNDRKKVQE